jgi:DUF1680 family protein
MHSDHDRTESGPSADTLDRLVTRRSILLSGCAFATGFGATAFAWPASEEAFGGALRAVPFTQVDVADDFWAPKMKANREVSIWHCLERQRVADFGTPKLIEGAAYMIAKQPYPELEAYIDRVIDKLLEEVRPRLSDPNKAVRVSGHFLEASVAYFAATGKPKMLDVALQDIDVIDANFGSGKRDYISEHEGQKIGLLQLYRQTDDHRCASLAQFFMDGRGKDDYPRQGVYAADRTYAQDQKPVVEQERAVGHCVRATFLYIALADMAQLFNRQDYKAASDRIWHDAVYGKTYLTGGIGSIRFHEQFGVPYELPNLSAWNETCAAYGNAVWNYRMFLLNQDAKYIDLMERVLYNGFASGVSIRGDRFFYQNPLKSFGNYERYDWIDVPCCPPNVVRLTASIGSYAYAQGEGAIYVNLFIASRARIELRGAKIHLVQETRYPWDGSVRLHVHPSAATKFNMFVRIPGWARNEAMPGDLYRYSDGESPSASLAINGKRVPIELEDGFARIERTWNEGDVVELQLPMPVRRVRAREEAEENRGMVALSRGPLVYCAEWPDNNGHALNIILPDDATLRSLWDSRMFGGVQVIEGGVKALQRAGNGKAQGTPHQLTAIPYYCWANRGMGEMATWMPSGEANAWIAPELPENIAEVASSGGVPRRWTGYNDQNTDIRAIYDGRTPISSADESFLYFKMRPPVGEPGWVDYRFRSPARLSSCRVYWFDDRRFCRLPASWKLLYQSGGQWVPVSTQDKYSVQKDCFNMVEFAPVKTMAIRVQIEPDTISYRAGEIGPPDAMFLKHDIDWREFGILKWSLI